MVYKTYDVGKMAARVLEKEFSTLTQEGRDAALNRAWEDQLWSVDGWISRQAVETNMDVLENSGIFQGEWSYEELVDMRFVKQLAPELGITLPEESAE